MASPPMVWPRGIGIWPTKIDPNMPLGSPIWEWKCGWYIAMDTSSAVYS